MNLKNALLLLMVTGFATVTFGQQAKVVSAYNYNKTGELDLAKEAIDLAAANESTSGKAKTWYYRGIIYHGIFETKNEKYKGLSSDALTEATRSYEKALELDTKNEYSDDIKKRINVASIQLLNQGVESFNQKKYDVALSSFETSAAISKKYFNKTDTLAISNSALAAERIGNQAKAIQYYNELSKLNYGGATTYRSLAALHKAAKDTAQALEVLKKGRLAYPNDANLIIDELNYYLEKGKTKEAEGNLKLAIEKEPNNKNLHFALGTIKDNTGQFEQAESSYKKAIEIDPSYFDAVYNLGALYFNKGVKFTEAADATSDIKKSNAENAKADEMFKKALPMLEKALTLNENDRSTLLSLKQLYARTGDNEKYKMVSDKLKN